MYSELKHKWYLVNFTDGTRTIFQAKELSYVYIGHAVFTDVITADGTARVWYIPVERIAFVMEDVEGDIVEEAKKAIAHS